MRGLLRSAPFVHFFTASFFLWSETRALAFHIPYTKMADGHAESSKKRDEESEEGLDFSPFWGIEKGAVLQEARCFNESQLDARRCQQVRLPMNLHFPHFCRVAHRLSFQVITKLLYLSNQGDSFTKVFLHSSSIPSSDRASNPNHLIFACLHVGRSYGGFLFCHKAFPVKRQQSKTDGLLDHKRDLSFCWWGWNSFLVLLQVRPSLPSVCLQVIIVTSSLMKDMNSKIDLYRSNAIRVLCNITDAGLLGQIERYLKQAVVDKNATVSSAALVPGHHLLQVNWHSFVLL